MFKKLFLLVLLFPLVCIGQDFQWVRQIKGIVYDYADFAEDSTIDSNGNTYVVGRTESPLFDLDPTATGTQISDNTLVQNFAGTYLVKVDSNGNYLWGLTFGNYPRGDNAYSVKIGTDGNIYILLSLMSYNSAASVIDTYITIVKLSPNGTTLLTKTIKQNYGGFNVMHVSSLDLDSQNNIFITGYFVGSLTVESTTYTLNAGGTWGIGNYVLKMDNAGNVLWVKQLNISTPGLGNKLIVRPDGNINLLAMVDGDYTLFNINNNDNSIIWQKDFINQEFVTFHVSPSGIVILGDKHGFSDVIDVDPSAGVSTVSSYCVFTIFLDLNGNFEEVKIYERDPVGYLKFTAVTTDTNGKYYFGGFFTTGSSASSTIDFDASSSVSAITSPADVGFYLKMDQNRNFESVLSTGPNNSYLIRNINVLNDYMYVTGQFQGMCDFDPSPTSNCLLNTLNGGVIISDGFILKLGPCDSLVPNAINVQTFCSSDNPTVANLSPNSGSNKWYSSLTSTTQLPVTTPLINGQTYYVSKQVGSCPESTKVAVTVTINISPIQPNVTTQSFCDSDNATLSSLIISGSNLVFYDAVVGGNIIAANTPLVNNVTYYISQTVNNCESSRATINIPIIPSTTPSIISPQTFCIQQNATISNIIITGSNIKWYDAAIGGNILAINTILQNGVTYYASQTSTACESSRVPVLINIQNTAAPTGVNSQTFCAVQNPTLNNILVTGTTINWYSSASSTIILPFTTLLTDGNNYYATQTLYGCESVGRLPVTITLISTLNAANYATTICDIGNDNSENIDLSQFNANLISLSGNTFTYYNSLNGAVNQTASEEFNANHNIFLGLNTIYVRIDSVNGCHQIVQLQLTMVKVPIVNIADEVILCENNRITVTAGSFNSYTWSTGATTSSIVVTQPGNYSVTVTQNHGSVSCSSTKNFTVVLSNAPIITSIDTVDWTDAENSITINLSSISIGDYEYSIDGITFQNSNTFNGLPNGAYTITVRDKNKCGIDTEEVYLLNYPKFFTPNNDGHNDGWSIKYSQFESNFEVRIFDRFGKLLAILPNNKAWDGKYNGKQLPADDYWFNVIRNDGRIHKGHFALLR